MADTLSVQPWPRQTRGPGALKDVLAQLNFERGHFRDITEASLQEEIAADGALQLSEEEEDEDEDVEMGGTDEVKSKPRTREELFKAKYELQTHVNAAHQEVMMAVDFISLLLSKEVPKAGASTMSPDLKKMVPLGTLGMDSWQRMPTNQARDAQDEILATNVRIQGIQNSADALLSAATRLEDNVRKETQYWDQVLKVSEGGWTVCRMPGQQHRLGVRFGFMESSPEFSRRGMAALNSSSTGKIFLERGVGQKPRALHVALRRGNRVVGASRLPQPPNDEDTTLEARIKYARDSLYDEELYHEMVRESRALPSLGVSMQGSAIQFQSSLGSDDDLTISFDLASLEDDPGSLSYDPSSREDQMAQASALAARLLLTQAHRERLKRRSQIPPPMTEEMKEKKPLLPLLRPLMALFMQQTSLMALNTYLRALEDVLKAASIECAVPTAFLRLPPAEGISKSEDLISVLLQPWSSEAVINIRDPAGRRLSFTFAVQTELSSSNSFGSIFSLSAELHNPVYRFDSFKELSSAADMILSSALAEACLPSLGNEWTCNEDEAFLVRGKGSASKTDSIWMTLEDGGRSLTLASRDRTFEWSSRGKGTEVGFWEAARSLSWPAAE
jgi:mediator of RNA polymerase II transcription subunit 17, fungi type